MACGSANRKQSRLVHKREDSSGEQKQFEQLVVTPQNSRMIRGPAF
jgi:hypothetical protein